MSSKYLGESFDIHCGGEDNIFPHHENEIAQSEAYTGKKFVNYWLHCHHLIRDGEKMSKSRGNTISVSEILQVKDNPAALRFLLLSTHYRKTLNFTFDALDQAQTALNRVNEFAGKMKYGRDFPEGETESVGKMVEEAEKGFREGLGDDLNISVALTALFNLVKKANISAGEGKVKKRDAGKISAFLESINGVLGVINPIPFASLKGEVSAGSVTEADLQVLSKENKDKIDRREKARAEKDFALADKIRRELLEDGIVLEDTKDGPRWKIMTAVKKKE
jgi:cysteinyl-tRNA synthetase